MSEYEKLVEIVSRGTNDDIYNEIQSIASNVKYYMAAHPNIFVMLEDIKAALKMVEGQKPSTNTAMDAIALCKDAYKFKPTKDNQCPMLLAALISKMESIAQQHQ